jgi:AAA domain/UvrD-like helicase C-terminal domain
MSLNIESLVSWDAGKEVSTRRGPRTLRQANPTPEFWAAWRRSKSLLQAAGVSATKDSTSGEWVALWWTDPASVTAPAPATPLMNWSPEQTAIFGFFATGTGNAIVQARAGTGKTTTIKQAFSHVADPDAEMLYAVFNTKNKDEAQAKITDGRVDIRTLHSLGFSYIKSVWPKSAPDGGLESERIFAACPNIDPEAVVAVIRLVGFAKNLHIGIPTDEQLLAIVAERELICGVQAPDGSEQYPAARLAGIALAALKLSLEPDAANRISFDDMVWLPVAKGWVTPRYDLVVIDEAQDMNLPQLEAAVRSCRASGRIVVVGDDRQAIYGFRGAASDGMGAMKDRLDARTFGLTVTYRCPKVVVAEAAKIVPDYHAADAAPEGSILGCQLNHALRQITPGDALLSRSNAPLVSAYLGLLRAGTPARIQGREIGDQLMGMVRKLKAKSVPDFFRKLGIWARKQTARRPKSADEIRDQHDTLAAIAEGCSSVSEIERRMGTMFSDTDRGYPCVVLSTVHKAKGLEWDRVFMLEWTFKHASDEDQNIYYVAITRTKKTLVFVEKDC